MEEEKWTTIDPQVWEYKKENDSIEGVLVNKRQNIGKNNSNAYDIDDQKNVVMVWGSTILDKRMAFVNVGDRVRITYKGKESTKAGNDIKIFKVERIRQKL